MATDPQSRHRPILWKFVISPRRSSYSSVLIDDEPPTPRFRRRCQKRSRRIWTKSRSSCPAPPLRANCIILGTKVVQGSSLDDCARKPSRASVTSGHSSQTWRVRRFHNPAPPSSNNGCSFPLAISLSSEEFSTQALASSTLKAGASQDPTCQRSGMSLSLKESCGRNTGVPQILACSLKIRMPLCRSSIA